ncbi:uncharacterized protein LOC144749120 [Ciona intestinalis]
MDKGPSFAQVVHQKGGGYLKRPTCLSFKTKDQSKIEDVIKIIGKEKFPVKNLIGISERKGNLIDVTCTTRKAVLELYEILIKVDALYSVRLYESDKVNVAVGWVPIPFPNEVIKSEFQNRCGEVKHIQHRKDRNDLLTGMRILTLDRADIEKNPIPSYITVNNYEFYCTYNGQQITCKYCTKAGHKQQNCPKRKEDYPKLTNKRNEENQEDAECPETDKSGSKLTAAGGEIKERSKQNGERLDQNTTAASGKSSNLKPILPDKNQSNEMESTHKVSRKRQERSPTEINLHQAKSISLSELKIPVSCPKCEEEGYVTDQNTNFFCWKCSSEFRIATACCNENDKFLVPDKEVTTNCSTCHLPMRKMPCCHIFQPEFQTDEGTLECIQCKRYSMTCICKTVNSIPKRTMTSNCINNACNATLVHCSCGKKTCQIMEPDKPYQCECGFEYEYDIYIGVERI